VFPEWLLNAVCVFANFVVGLRKVYPYYFNYCTYVKERWFGLSLM